MEIQKIEDGGKATRESTDIFEMHLQNQKLMHYMGMLIRPGVAECAETLEYTHYPPNTDRNNLFHARLLYWANLHWLIMSIPKEEQGFMQEAAAKNGLRIGKGIPVIIGGGKFDQFFYTQDNLRILENVPDHPVYKNGPTKAV